MTHSILTSRPAKFGKTFANLASGAAGALLMGVLRAVRSLLATALLVIKDCQAAMLGNSISVAKVFEMIYVEPYQPRRHEDWSDPDNF